MTGRGRLSRLAAFAAAMAYLEAAVVVYLRRIYYPDSPLSLFPLRVWSPAEVLVEAGREIATIVMILAAALLAERGGTRVFAAFCFVFGLWDALYYFWLKVLIGWPVSWGDWDILFLIPWAWLGPWPAPVLVAAILALWGGAVVAGSRPFRFTARAASLFAVGALLVLISFLAPGFPLIRGGPEAAAAFSPGGFSLSVFLPGALGIALGLAMTRPLGPRG